MPAVPEELKRGSIILAKLNDHRGSISEHFAVVLTKTDDIVRGNDLVVAGISTRFSMPLPNNWLFLENKPIVGDEITGLKEACVVKADWLDALKQSDIIKIVGRVRASTMRQLLKALPE